MKVALINRPKQRLAQLCRGIAASGDEVVAEGEPAQVAVISNWGDATLCMGVYEHALVCECGYLGNRNEWLSLAWDGLNGRGRHGVGPERPEVPLAPWRANGDGYALILGQVPTDWAVRVAFRTVSSAHAYEEWLGSVVHELERRGYPVRYRPHPEVYMQNLNVTRAQRPLLEELAGARIAVTLNSTAAIDAICAGVPTVIYDRRGSMARAMASKFDHYEEPPNRRAWIQSLARMQWHMSELESGLAWKTMKELL